MKENPTRSRKIVFSLPGTIAGLVVTPSSLMFQRIRIFFFYGILATLPFSGCKDPNETGLQVQPPNDKINVSYYDGLALNTFTLKEDSIRSDETSLNLLGSYTDPVFGTAKADIYTQFRLPTSNVDFAASLPADSTLRLDSVYLSIAYSGGYYGDTTTSQTVRVYELTEDMYKDSIYYSSKAFTYNASEIGSLSFVPHTHENVTVKGNSLDPQLRIKLSNAFGQKFIDESGSANLADNDAFTQFFKGLYLTVDDITIPNQGAILYFDLLASQSKITLYYNDSLSYDFIIDGNCSRIGHFDHFNYTGTPVAQQLSDSTLGDSLTYIQAMAGVKTRIRMPGLKGLLDSGQISVNKAELIIPVEDDNTEIFLLPSKLLLTRIDSTGSNTYTPDEFEGTAYFGGTYNSSSKEYRFNIARYVQDVLNGMTTDYGLYLLASGSAVSANRAVLYGGKHSKRIKLKITYTKL